MKKVILAILAMLSCFAFVACVPSNVEKAEAKMEKEGYIVRGEERVEDVVLLGGLVGGLVATKLTDTINAYLFSSKAEAKDFYEKLSDKTKSKAIQDGKWIYWGTEDAIDDFKG